MICPHCQENTVLGNEHGMGFCDKDTGLKLCPRCRIRKSVTKYYRRNDGRPSAWCKACLIEHATARKAINGQA
jgi:hypothetical protein